MTLYAKYLSISLAQSQNNERRPNDVPMGRRKPPMGQDTRCFGREHSQRHNYATMRDMPDSERSFHCGELSGTQNIKEQLMELYTEANNPR